MSAMTPKQREAVLAAILAWLDDQIWADMDWGPNEADKHDLIDCIEKALEDNKR